STLTGNGQPKARWQAHSALATKLINTASRSVRYGGTGPSWSRHSRSVCPERSSCAARQTTSGCSPGCAMNSKSWSHISRNGNSLGVTGGPFQKQRMLRGIDQASFVAEGEAEDFRFLEAGPLRFTKAPSRRRENFVAVVVLVREQSHPFVDALHQTD